MSDPAIHPDAPHTLPYFIPGPDGSDPMFNHIVILVVVAALIIGNLYLRLHSVPERMAHSTNHIQLQAITILTLLALFTHNHVFWVAALLIAVIRFPDFSTPLNTIAQAAEQFMADRKSAPPSQAANAPESVTGEAKS